MEKRRLLAVIVWDGEAADNDWNNAANWFDETNDVNDVKPGPGDDAEIRAAFAGETIESDENEAIRSLTSEANLTISDGTFEITTGESTVHGDLDLGRGALTGAGDITVDTMQWSRGTLSGSGETVVQTTLNISGGNEKTLQRTLTNEGTAAWTGDGNIIGSGGVLNNQAGAVLDIRTDSDFHTPQFSSPGTINNEGRLQKSAGTGANTIEMVFNNTGTVDVQTGELRLVTGGTSSGDWRVAADARLDIRGQTITLGANDSIEGAGTVEFTGGTTTIAGDGTYDVTGTTDLSSGLNGRRVDFDLDATTTTMLLSGGARQDASKTLTVRDTLTWTGGILGGSGETIVQTTLNISGSGDKTLWGTLTNEGTASWTGSGIIETNGGVFNNLALFDIRTNSDFDTPQFQTAGTINNAGTVQKSTGTGANTLDLIFDNTGTVDVQTGELRFTRGGTSGGDWTVPADTRLEFRGNHNITLGVDDSIEGAGTVEFTGGTVTIGGNGTYDVTATDVSSGLTGRKVEFNLNATTTTMLLSGGASLGGSETLTVRDTLTWSGGTITGTGETVVQTTLNMNGGDKTLRGTLTNEGTATWTGGEVNGSGGVFNNRAGAVFDIRTNSDFDTPQFSGPGTVNNAGILRKSGGTGTTRLEMFFDNTGTVEAAKGVLELVRGAENWNDNESALEGGFWIVSTADPLVSSATLRLRNVDPFTINRADIVLEGANALFENDANVDLLGDLRRIDPGAHLTIRNGADLNLSSGDFENLGELTAGAGSTLGVDGMYTQAADARLTVVLAGDPGTGLFGGLNATGEAQLDGTFAIALADGFGPTAGQSYEVMTFPSRTGSFADLEGLYLGATQAFEVIENPDSVLINALVDANDLAVDPLSVELTASGVVNEDVTVSYTVENLTDRPAEGSWFDSLYLSSGSALDPGDVLLGRIEHTGGLAALDSYTESLTVPLPGVLPGNYRVIVVEDSRGLVPDQNRADNTAVSPESIQAQYEEIPVGGSVSGTIGAGQSSYYQLNVPPAEDVLLSGQFDSPAGVEIYVQFGQVPTLAESDHFVSTAATTEPSVLLSRVAGPHYVLLRGRPDLAAGPRSFELAAEALGLTVTGVSPEFGSNAGSATTTINGSGFTDGATVLLSDGAGTERPASEVVLSDSNTLYATFDLGGLDTEAYHVVVQDGSDSATLAESYTVTEGQTGELETRLTAPDRVLYRRPSQVVVEYANTGETDVRAPLLEVRSLSDGIFLRQSPAAPYRPDAVQLLGINRSGPAGVLPPGSSYWREVEFISDGPSLNETVFFVVRVIDEPDAVINWQAFKEDLRSEGFAADAWDEVFNRFVSFMDLDGDGESTLGEYEQVLADTATYLGRLGEHTDDVPRMISFLVGVANNQYPNLTLSRSVDARAPAAGMPLTWQRSFLQPISRRYHMGPFGRGWTSSWDWRAETDDNLTVTIQTLGGTRTFRPDSDGTFVGNPGELAVLSRDGTDYVLREANGDRLRFDIVTGRLLNVADRNGNSITLSYTAEELTELLHSNGDRFTLEYENGRIIKLTDHAGRETTYAYDPTRRYLTSVSGPDGTTEYTYETTSGLAEHALLSVTRPDATTTFFEYDEFGRLTARMEDAGQERATLEYGNFTEPGRIALTDEATGASTAYLFNDRAKTEAVTNPAGETLRFDYDDLSRMTAAALPGNLTYGIGYEDSISASYRDALGQSTTVTFAPSFGELTEYRDELGRRTDYTLDTNGNTQTVTYADGSSENITHDAEGNIATYTNRRGQQIDYTYDARGQLLREDHADGSFREFTYDDRGNLTSATGAGGTIDLTYDGGDRLTRIDYPDGRFLAYDRDPGGRLAGITYPGGHEVNYDYDAVGRIRQLTDGAGDPLVTYTYDSAGRQIRQNHGNGTFTTFAYNAVGQPSQIEHHAPDGTVRSSYTYEYDELGRRTSATTASGTTEYGYDVRGQLTSVALPSGRTIEYVYDSAGRRLQVIDQGATTNYVSSELEQYTLVGDAAYTHDADGNLVRIEQGEQVTSYDYDDYNRLVRVEDATDVWTYEYDALGQRVASTHNGVRTEHLVDPLGLGNVAAEYDAGGDLLTRYLYTGDGPLAQIASSGDSSYYEFDASGSVVALTDAGGAPVNQYDYLPFGEVLQSNEAVENRYTFGGALGASTDGTGLSFMRNRYYEAATGSFLSIDPLRTPPVDPYGYAANNPVQLADPRGTNPFLNSLRNRTDALNNLADFGEDGISTNQLQAVECAGENVANNVDEFQGNLTTNISLPLPGALGLAHAVYSVAGLYEMAQTIDDDGQGDGGGPGSGGGDGGSGGSGAGGGGGGGGSGAACCSDCGGGPGGGGGGGSGSSDVVGSFDPNDIIGPAGFGEDRFLSPGTTLPYTIQFENLESATAPAQKVVITQQLDGDLDLSTFELGDFGFGELVVDVPEGRNAYSTRLDLRHTAGVLVDVAAEVNLSTGLATWSLTSLDPTTLDLPSDPFLGFLPPNGTSPEGQGFVHYSIQSHPELLTGTRLDAQATIVFDANDPIDTPAIFNTIDAKPPESNVLALPATTTASEFLVEWAGLDDPGGSGIGTYDVYVAEDGGPFSILFEDTTATSGTFSAQDGHSYAFYSVATDNVGHRERPPATPDAETSVVVPTEVVGRHVFYNDSAFDDGPAANAADDSAIAPSPTEATSPELGKTALLPGGTASFQSITSYDKGLNGIMVDIGNLADTTNLSTSDFTFKTGNDDSPNDWGAAPDPSSVTVRPGAGEGGSDRVTLIWPAYEPPNPDPATQAVAGRWLEVTVEATANTGLTEPDVFYFGNAPGDSGTGNTSEYALVSAIDFGTVRDNLHSPNKPALIDDFADYNRDSLVNVIDFGLVRDNPASPNNALKFITVPAASEPEELAGVQPTALHDAALADADGDSIESIDMSWLMALDLENRTERFPSSSDTAREAVEKLLATW